MTDSSADLGTPVRDFCLYAKSNGDAGDDRFLGYDTISLPNRGVRRSWQLMPAAYTQAIDGCVFTSDLTQWVLTSGELKALRQGETRTFDLGGAVIDRDLLAELPPMVAIDSQPFFAIGRSVMTVRDNIAQVHVTANGGVQHLSTSTPHTAPRIAIATDYSLEIAGASGFDHQIVNTGADYSHVRFLHGGRLAAITGRNLEVYQRNSKHVYALRESIQLENEPVASLVTVSVSMLAVVYAEGRVARFTLHA